MKMRMVLLCVLIFLGAAAARAEEAAVFEETSLRTVAFGDEQAYVLDEGGTLWAWDYAGEPEALCPLPVCDMAQGYFDATGEALQAIEAAVFELTASEDALYALNPYSGRIGTVDGEGVHWTADFDASGLIAPYGWAYRMSGLTVTDGALVALVDRDMLGAQVLRVDLATGATAFFDAPDTIAMCPQGERLLLIRMPWDGAAMETGEMRLMAMNPSDGALTELPHRLPASNDWSVSLAASEDAVYLLTNGVFYMCRDGETFEALQRGPEYAGSLRLLPRGAAAYVGRGARVCPLAAEPASEKLVVRCNGFMSEITETFASRHPDALLQVLNGSVDAADVADHIRGGDAETDVFVVKVDAAFGALMDKGFAVPLDDHPVIAASAEKLYPAIRAALTDGEGRLVAYPSDVNVVAWGYDAALWQQHFGDRQPPETYLELFQMMRDFLADDDGDYFFDEYDYPTMISYVIKAYLAAHGDEAVFDSPALRETLALLAEVQRELRERRLESWDVYEIYSELDDSYHALLWWTLAYSDHQAWLDNSDRSFFPTVDGVPAARCDMYALIVNPRSERQALAKDFVALFARPDMHPVRYALLHTDAQPSKRLNSRGEEEWEVSPEALEAWAAVAQTLRFGERTLLAGEKMTERIEGLVARYAEGQLTLDRMLEQLDQVAGMILSEQ